MKKKINNVKNLKLGFTLLELLVVVLIIGILASIALPQYRKAVAKAELAQIINITKSIKLAQERYYLVNNQYTSDLNKLDININNTNVNCYSENYADGSISCYNKNFAFYVYLNDTQTECAAKTNNANSHLGSACKNVFKKPEYCGVYSLGICGDILGIERCFVCITHEKYF